MANSDKYEKIALYLSAGSIFISIIGSVTYVAVSLAQIETRLDAYKEQMELLEDRLSDLTERYTDRWNFGSNGWKE